MFEILDFKNADLVSNYKIISLFTTNNPSRGCFVCLSAYKEFQLVFKSFEKDSRKENYPFELFFALVDYDESPKIFRSVRNEIQILVPYYHKWLHVQLTSS
jgi:hypothetical protein